jgi:hypothetical protein
MHRHHARSRSRDRHDVKMMLERPPDPPKKQRRPKSRGAVDQAEHRQREREGVVRCVYVPIHWRVLAAMIERGLSEADGLDPRATGREAGDVLLQWADRWFAERR